MTNQCYFLVHRPKYTNFKSEFPNKYTHLGSRCILSRHRGTNNPESLLVCNTVIDALENIIVHFFVFNKKPIFDPIFFEKKRPPEYERIQSGFPIISEIFVYFNIGSRFSISNIGKSEGKKKSYRLDPRL